MDKQIVISIKTIFLTLLLILAGYILYRLGPILALLLIAVLIVFSIEPFIQKIISIKIFGKNFKRNSAVIISYIIVIGLLIGAFTLIIPPIAIQLKKLIDSFPFLIQKLEKEYAFSLLDAVPANFLSGEKSIFSTAKSVVITVFSVFTVFVLAIFTSLDWPNLINNLVDLLPAHLGKRVRDTVDEIQVNISSWLRGELILMLIVGLFSFLGLWIIGVDYPLALGIISGLFEVIPNFGPFLSAMCAGAVGFAESPVKGAAAIFLFIVIQQLENSFLVPKIMQKVSGFSPLVILLALLTGARLFGLVGAILAVPMTMVFIIILRRVLAGSEN